MLNYLKKGEIANFIQVYDKDNNPKIKCYLKDNYPLLMENKKYVGYGNISIDKENIVHLYSGNINIKHLDKYKESKKKRKNTLTLMVH